MSTPNFSKYNTTNYCVILDENHTDDYDYLLEDLGYCAEDCGFYTTSDYNDSMKMNVFAERSGYENKYNTDLTEVEMTAQVGIINGYYADATLDFDIILTPTISGYKYRLSVFGSIFEMIDSILSDMEAEVLCQQGYDTWNVGIWKMNKEKVRTWLLNTIMKEYDKCNDFCEKNCETKLVCMGVFSNGEAVYRRAE